MRLLGLAVTLCLVQTFPSASAKQPLKPSDITNITNFPSLIISPEGHTLAYEQSDFDTSANSTVTNLWLLDLKTNNATKRLANHSADPQYSWSPDGTKYCYVLADDQDGDNKAGSAKKSRHARDRTVRLGRKASADKGGAGTNSTAQLRCGNNGENSTVAITAFEDDIAMYIWSTNSKNIAILTLTKAPELTLPNVRIFTSTLYGFHNDYTAFSKSAQIWTVDVADLQKHSAPKSLKILDRTTSLVSWSADSSAVIYTVNTEADLAYRNSTQILRTTSVSDGKDIASTEIRIPGKKYGLVFGAPQLVPDPGVTKFVFDEPDPEAPELYAQQDLYLMDAKTSKVECISKHYDHDLYSPRWADNDTIIAYSIVNGSNIMVEVDVASQKVTPLQTDDLSFYNIAVTSSADPPRTFAIAVDATSAEEVYEVKKHDRPHRLTKAQDWFREAFDIPASERILYRGPGGQNIEAFINRPPAFDENEKYPLIVFPHGGPYSAYDGAFDQDAVMFSQAGNVVLRVNCRGSAGYGQAFGSALEGNWPGYDYDDNMAGVDYMLSKYNYIDSSRLAIVGASGGGVLTDWAVTHTNRFAAAVSISDIADFQYLWYVDDLVDMRKRPDGQKPWKLENDYKHSAVNFVDENTKTPTMFIMGTKDFRCPPSVGSLPMYRLWKYYNIPTALVIFEEGGHTAVSPDEQFPAQRADLILKWLDQYMNGKPAAEFDVLTVGGF